MSVCHSVCVYCSNWAGVCLDKAEVAMVHLDTTEKEKSSWVAASSAQCTVGSVWSGEAAGSNPENCYLHLAQARPEAHRWRKLLQRIC